METEFETIGARRIHGDPHEFYSKKPNRNVTLPSLIAFFQLLKAENQEDFCAYYLIALKCLITEFYLLTVILGSNNKNTSLSNLIVDYTYLDGSPCGKLEN